MTDPSRNQLQRRLGRIAGHVPAEWPVNFAGIRSYIESFNGKFRDECLNEHWFITMAQARRVIELWRIEYNTERPHSSIGNITPQEYAEKLMAKINDEALLSTADSRSERD